MDFAVSVKMMKSFGQMKMKEMMNNIFNTVKGKRMMMNIGNSGIRVSAVATDQYRMSHDGKLSRKFVSVISNAVGIPSELWVTADSNSLVDFEPARNKALKGR